MSLFMLDSLCRCLEILVLITPSIISMSTYTEGSHIVVCDWEQWRNLTVNSHPELQVHSKK